jgi:hypothetical protein
MFESFSKTGRRGSLIIVTIVPAAVIMLESHFLTGLNYYEAFLPWLHSRYTLRHLLWRNSLNTTPCLQKLNLSLKHH